MAMSLAHRNRTGVFLVRNGASKFVGAGTPAWQQSYERVRRGAPPVSPDQNCMARAAIGLPCLFIPAIKRVTGSVRSCLLGQREMTSLVIHLSTGVLAPAEVATGHEATTGRALRAAVQTK